MHISKQLFSEVLDKLSPSTAETEVFEGHRRVIGKILKGDDVAAVLPIGSRRRGTALAQTSDYDLLVLYRRRTLVYAGKLTSPSTVLRRLKKAICKRYPHSDIRRDGQAIVVRFAKSGCSIDL